jgi:hypothetical protein
VGRCGVEREPPARCRWWAGPGRQVNEGSSLRFIGDACVVPPLRPAARALKASAVRCLTAAVDQVGQAGGDDCGQPPVAVGQ